MIVPAEVLRAWDLEGTTLEPIPMGHINPTFRAGDFILQKLNPVFGPEVHHDIEAVTGHLEAHGQLTPRLVRSEAGELWFTAEDGGIWRLQTRIEGTVITHGTTIAHCREAGRLLGAVHVALDSLEHDFLNVRPEVHDTRRHRDHLAQVLDTHANHAGFAEVEPIGHAILDGLDALPPLRDLPLRIVHGDPKISNVIFDDGPRARCLIDLDTFSRMAIPVELGDAFRSWCNTSEEDDTDASFDLGLFCAGLDGYATTASGLLTDSEVSAIVPGVETIALELAARFCADALEESYFGWSRERFSSSSAHNQQRASAQLNLGRAIHAKRAAMEEAVRVTLR